MSNTKSNQKSLPVLLPEIRLSNKIALKISDEIMDKVKYLCKEISQVEWSGILFYSVEGTISEFDKIVLTVEDIFLMDKGTTGFTSYELGPEIVKYQMADPKRLTWKMGHIHSHNNMNVFFSGTDMEELHENSEFHNYYLSLIVNNRMEMEAKVAFRGKTNGYTCLDEKGEEWTLNLKESKDTLFVFPCDIVLETPKVEVDKSFKERVKEVIKKSNKTQQHFNKNFNKHKSLVQKTQQQRGFPEWPDRPTQSITMQPDDIEDFTRYIIRLGNNKGNKDDIEKALEDVERTPSIHPQLVLSILDAYPGLYKTYFNNLTLDSMEHFVFVTEAVLEEIDSWGGVYTFAEKLTDGIKTLLMQLEFNKVGHA